MKMSINAAWFKTFRMMFSSGYFHNQRFGQAFFNHFNLHIMSNQDQFKDLYELNEDEAMVLINELFELEDQ